METCRITRRKSRDDTRRYSYGSWEGIAAESLASPDAVEEFQSRGSSIRAQNASPYTPPEEKASLSPSTDRWSPFADKVVATPYSPTPPPAWGGDEAVQDEQKIASKAKTALFQSPEPWPNSERDGIAGALSPQAGPSDPRPARPKRASDAAHAKKRNVILPAWMEAANKNRNAKSRPPLQALENTQPTEMFGTSPPAAAKAPLPLPAEAELRPQRVPDGGLSGVGAVIERQPAWLQSIAKAVLCVCVPRDDSLVR